MLVVVQWVDGRLIRMLVEVGKLFKKKVGKVESSSSVAEGEDEVRRTWKD